MGGRVAEWFKLLLRSLLGLIGPRFKSLWKQKINLSNYVFTQNRKSMPHDKMKKGGYAKDDAEASGCCNRNWILEGMLTRLQKQWFHST